MIQAQEEMMVSQYAHPEVLASTEWVAERIQDSSIVVVEVNADLSEHYEMGHLPGAVGWSLHADLEDQVKRDIPGIAQFEALLGRSGIDRGATVVLYGDGNNRSATWAFWVLKIYRHPDARIMDGGRAKWVSEGRELSTEAPAPGPAVYRASAPDGSLRAMKSYVAANLGKPGFKPLDTRTIEEFTGQLASAPGTPQPDIYRKGRLPGAVHVPWDDASEDGKFRPAEELRRMYEAKGLSPKDEVVPYCRLGVRASYSWFALKYLLGYPRVRNYDGSWTEWGNSAGSPVETGPA